MDGERKTCGEVESMMGIRGHKDGVRDAHGIVIAIAFILVFVIFHTENHTAVMMVVRNELSDLHHDQCQNYGEE